MNKYLLIGVVAILAITGGWWYVSQPNTPVTPDTTQSPPQHNSTAGSNSKGTQSSVTASKSGWVVTINQQISIRFENPADALVSSVEQRETIDGTTIHELIVTPKGTDPTRVHFFSTNAPFEQAKKIQIYQSEVSNSKFADDTIDGLKGVRRTDYNPYNDCTNELTVVEKNGVVYGSQIAQCPTHSQGYDQLRRDIAHSLKFL